MDTHSSVQQKLSPQAVQDGVTGGYEATCSSIDCCRLGRSIPQCSGWSIEGPAAGDHLGRHGTDLPWAGSGGAGVSATAVMNHLLLRPAVHHLCSRLTPSSLHKKKKKNGGEGRRMQCIRSTHFGCTRSGTEDSCDTRPASSSPSLCITHTYHRVSTIWHQMTHSIPHSRYYRAGEGYGTTVSPDIGGGSNMDLYL